MDRNPLVINREDVPNVNGTLEAFYLEIAIFLIKYEMMGTDTANAIFGEYSEDGEKLKAGYDR